jgi:hypothetical protein
MGVPADQDVRVALVAGATRGAGRAIAVTAVGVTPGWLRSEKMLDNFGVTEDTWREACVRTPGFAISESPAYVGRGVAALAMAADAARWAGTIVSARQLADAYGVTDTDGSKPDTMLPAWPEPWTECAAPCGRGWPSGGATAGLAAPVRMH